MTLLIAQAVIEMRDCEILRGCKRCLWAACCVLMLAASCFAAGDSSTSKPCRDSVDSYIGYKLSDVRLVTPLAIKTPLSFLFGSQKKFQDQFAAVLSELALKKGEPFDRAAHGLAMELLSKRYEEEFARPGERIRVAFVTFRLENCDDAARTVGLTYLVYSTEFLYHLSRVFEKPNDRFTRSLAPGRIDKAGSLANINGKLLPQPIVGYDRERELFGGGKAVLNTENGIVNQMSLAGTASPNSATGVFNLAGNREFTRSRFLSYAEWRLGYNYFNLPSDQNRIKAGTGLAQIFGASKPLGSSSLVFRFGASVEGGNRQSELPVNDPELAQLLGYGALKAYLGATANQGRRSWSASYALQLSNDGSDASIDYTKHLFDASYRWRYLWREHFPFRLEAQFSAGAIQTHGGPVPVAERFFGGNKIRSFIDGDDWIINSAPFIRSFPQTTFNLIGPNAPFGGEHFFSANLTLSQPVWNYPAVPNEISQEPLVRDGLGGALRTARVATVQSYLQDEPQYQAIEKALLGDAAVAPPADVKFRGNLVELSQTLAQVEQKVKALKAQTNLPPEVADAIKDILDEESEIDSIAVAKAAIQSAQTDRSSFKARLRELIVGFVGSEGLITELVGTPQPDPTGLEGIVDALRSASSPVADELSKDAADLQAISDLMAPEVKKLMGIGAVNPKVFKDVMAVVNADASGDDVDGVVRDIAKIVAGIKKRTNTMPTPGRAVLLQPTDIQLAKRLAIKLRDAKDPVPAFLNSQFTAEMRGLLAAYKGKEEPSDELVRAMISELNRLISGPSLYDEQRFQKIELSEETEELADNNPEGPELIALNRALLAQAFPGVVAQSEIDNTLEPLAGYLKDAIGALDALVGFESNDAEKVRGPIHQLVVGFGDLAPPVTTSISTQIKKLQQPLATAGFATEARNLLAESDKLSSLQKHAYQAFNKVRLNEMEQQADRDIAFAARSLDVIFREINLVEIAPVVTFDAARIGPGVSPGFGKTHYGLGAGVRFSIVTLDFTAGYSFNLNRQPTEPRGAVLLSMTISDLFR